MDCEFYFVCAFELWYNNKFPRYILASLTLTASTLGNVGPGIGEFGPGTSMNSLTDSAKLLCCFLMVLGRLELYTILILFTPAFWKNN